MKAGIRQGPGRQTRKDGSGRIHGGIRKKLSDHPEVDAEQGVRAVFHLLTEKVSAGEIEDVKTMLPKHCQDLWLEAA